MPQIKPYTPNVGAPGPAQTRRATGEDFGAAIGQGAQALGQATSQAGEMLQKRAEQSERSDLNAKMAKFHADMTNEWQETLRTADPADKTVAEKFNKKVDDQLGQIEGDISTRGGQLYFKQAASELQGHFSVTAAHGQAELAGIKAKQDYTQSLNDRSSAVINDPSSFELAKQQHSDGLSNLVATGGLSIEAAEKLKTTGERELAKSAIRGWIKVDPKFAQQQLDGGKWNTYIDGDVKHQMFGEVKVAEAGARADEERQQKEADRIMREKQEKTQNDFLQKLTSNSLSAKEILGSNLDAFGSGSKEQFIKLIEENSKGGVKTDPGTYISLFERIHSPEGDPKRIGNENDLNQYFGHGLNMESLNALRGEVQGKKTIDGTTESELKKGVAEIAKGMLTKSNPMTGIRDSEGDTQYLKFMTYFLKTYAEERQKGKSPIDLLGPDSPNYLGKQIRNYVRSQDQIIKDMIDIGTGSTTPRGGGLAAPSPSPSPTATSGPSSTATPTPLAPPTVATGDKARKSGESPADYLKRIGK